MFAYPLCAGFYVCLLYTSKYTITGIAGKKGFASISVDKDLMNSEIGFGRKVLGVFEDNGISFEHMRCV